MDYNLKQRLVEYFQNIENPTNTEQILLQSLQSGIGYFPITRVSRDDLKAKGFWTNNVDDATMERLASKMGDAYLDNGYWIDLEIIAEHLDIPKRKYFDFIKIGTKVWWNDPEGCSDGEYEIYNVPDEIEEDSIIVIGNGVSEAEVLPTELEEL